jgi:hypothetical protein
MARRRPSGGDTAPAPVEREPDLEARRNGLAVIQLAEHCRYSENDAAAVPKCLLEVPKTNAWRRFRHRYTQEIYEYREDEFDRFVNNAPKFAAAECGT